MVGGAVINYLAMVLALLLALILHEMAHAAAAKWNGDYVSAIEGRLSLNPLHHLDLFGTLLLPLFLYLVSSPFLLGYAKPVRINPVNFPHGRSALFMVAIAGPLSNFVLAGLTWLVINQVDQTKTGFSLQFLYFFLIYNLLLGLFNLMPFPPLDGSNMVKSILRGRLLTLYMLLEPIIFIAFLLLIFSGELGNVIRPWLEFLILKMSSM